MTLKEYLESYDEPLNEGLKGKINDFFNKPKPYRIGMDMIYPPTRAEKIKSWFIKLKRNMGKILLGAGIIASLSGMTASNFSDNYRDWDGYSSNQEKVLVNKIDNIYREVAEKDPVLEEKFAKWQNEQQKEINDYMDNFLIKTVKEKFNFDKDTDINKMPKMKQAMLYNYTRKLVDKKAIEMLKQGIAYGESLLNK